MKFTLFAASIAALALASGCNRAADEQRKADEARAEASEEAMEARRDAQLKINSARDEANEEISEAGENFTALRDDYRRDMNEKLVDLDEDIAELDKKLTTATGNAKTELQAKLPQIKAQREAFMAEYRTLETASAASWDATKERVNRAWNALDDSVDAVD